MTTEEQKKDSLMKVLAIAGFIAVLIFAVWLAVKIVTVVPGAFSSLASIADSVYKYNSTPELQIATEESVVNSGESFTLNWTEQRTDGTYSFMYECTEGVSVEIRVNGEITPVSCDTSVTLDGATSLEVQIASEKSRFVDVPFTISFTEEGAEEIAVSKRETITIVNASIPTSGVVVTEEPVEETPVTPARPVTTPVAQTPTTPTYTAGTPTTIKKVIYTIPTSDPKGNIDLQVTYLGVGTLSGNTFISQSSIDLDDEGALQFEVKNIGTKTAEDWSYKAELPSDITYTSGDQKALKPNERAIITLGFEGIAKKGTETISVEVSAKGDVKESNDEFSKSIKIVD